MILSSSIFILTYWTLYKQISSLPQGCRYLIKHHPTSPSGSPPHYIFPDCLHKITSDCRVKRYKIQNTSTGIDINGVWHPSCHPHQGIRDQYLNCEWCVTHFAFCFPPSWCNFFVGTAAIVQDINTSHTCWSHLCTLYHDIHFLAGSSKYIDAR